MRLSFGNFFLLREETDLKAWKNGGTDDEFLQFENVKSKMGEREREKRA